MDTKPSIKFDLSFIDEAQKYIDIYKKQGKRPSVEGFANRIGTDKASVIAWADKKKKDAAGNITDEYARPTFRAVVESIITLENAPEEDKLTPQQELFCNLYASEKEFFGNGTQSYIEAYGIDLSKPNAYRTAQVSASQNLSKPMILKRIREIMELGNFNDEFVDKELQFIIAQRADLSAKTAAIREYNKLKTRIIERVDHTTKGKEMPTPIYNGKSE